MSNKKGAIVSLFDYARSRDLEQAKQHSPTELTLSPVNEKIIAEACRSMSSLNPYGREELWHIYNNYRQEQKYFAFALWRKGELQAVSLSLEYHFDSQQLYLENFAARSISLINRPDVIGQVVAAHSEFAHVARFSYLRVLTPQDPSVEDTYQRLGFEEDEEDSSYMVKAV